jgi:hypothetical protein
MESRLKPVGSFLRLDFLGVGPSLFRNERLCNPVRRISPVGESISFAFSIPILPGWSMDFEDISRRSGERALD